MASILLIAALVALLILLGRTGENTRPGKVIEILDVDEDSPRSARDAAARSR